MFAKVKGTTLNGIFPEIIDVEVGLLSGLPTFQIVGLPDKAIQEAKERINLALKNLNIKPPSKINKRIVVNLAPADLKKEGPILDLPIALGFILASGQTKIIASEFLFLGELGLDGSLKKVRGALPIVLKAKDLGFKKVVLPTENLAEVVFIKDVEIYSFNHLKEVIKFLEGEMVKKPENDQDFNFEEKNFDLDFIVIDDYLLRGIILGVLGRHNFLLFGPPGTGKTLIAQNIVSLFPNLSYEESLEVSSIYSSLGLLEKELIYRPPFRSPHHSASSVAILGGGKDVKPGEVTLSHRGVLFFDELPEFRRDVLEGIREPLETGEITIARSKKSIKYPAKFLFIGAYNPCPCGFYGDSEIECQCSLSEINKYQKRISGPLFDRIDIHLNIPRLKGEKIFNMEKRDFKKIREKILEIREKILFRYQDEFFKNNSEIPPNKIKEYCHLDFEAEDFLKKAVDKFRLSLRGIHKALKLARTISDLEGKETIDLVSLGEALQYRIPSYD